MHDWECHAPIASRNISLQHVLFPAVLISCYQAGKTTDVAVLFLDAVLGMSSQEQPNGGGNVVMQVKPEQSLGNISNNNVAR